MYGYTAQQAAAAYGNYGSYAQGQYAAAAAAQQQQPQVTGQMGTGATSSTYSSAGYSYPTAASAYAQYGQTAAQPHPSSTTPVGYQQQPSMDYNADYASMFKAANTGYGGMTAGNAAGGRSSGTSFMGSIGTFGSATATPAAVMGKANAGMVGGMAGMPTSATAGNSAAAASHYSGYEAAVYAAASTYLQTKNTGQTGQWVNNNNKRPGGAMGMSGAVAGNKFQANKFQNKFSANKYPAGGNGQMPGGFQKKRYGLGHQNREVVAHYCEVCKVSCGGTQTYKEHLEGKLHKKKEALSRGDNVHSLPRLKVSFKCDVCNVTCTGRDTYEAHAKGVKHQKTVALLKKMNKPIPALEPTLIPPKEGMPAAGAAAAKKIVGVTGAKFVAGSKLSTTSTGVEGTETDATAVAVEQALLAESNVKPVGEEFIEEQRDASGKLIQYSCKLCECKFSDPNAKEIHLKGRRHRLQYKQKVNPALEVETKNTNAYGRKQQMQHQMRRPHGMMPPPPLRHFIPPPMMSLGVETSEDRHVIAKVNAIQLSKSDHDAVEKLVTLAEKTLKTISDKFAEEDATKAQAANSEGDKSTESERLLKGVMRVGLLAKNLLLKSDNEVELVVLCSKIPTKALLTSIEKMFPENAQKDEKDTLTVTNHSAESCIKLALSGIPYVCRVTLTCVLIREAESAKGGSATNESAIEFPADALPTEPCLKALAELRHAKWYQVKCAQLSSANMTLKIARDIGTRVKTWASLSNWTMELLVEKALSSINVPLSPGDAVRRLFEIIAGGIVLDKTVTVMDPCEKETIDVLGKLKNQEREDITSSAQHALRLISFNQIYKILGIERIPDRSSSQHSSGDRKRPRESNGLSADDSSDAKKEKKEESGVKEITVQQQ